MISKSAYPDFVEPPFSLAHLSLEERKKLIDSIQQESEKNYKKSLDEIISIFSEFDPLTLLSMLANYELMIGVGDEGIDREKQEKGLQQAHIEIVQALMLTLSETKGQVVTPDVYSSLNDAVKTLSFSFTFQRFQADALDLNEQEQAIRQIQEMTRSHTQVVRNWGNFSQVNRISKKLYEFFDQSLSLKYGFSATELIDFMNVLMNDLEYRITDRFQKLKNVFSERDIEKIATKYNQLIGATEKDIEETIRFFQKEKFNLEQVMSYVITHYDLRISENYIFDIEELACKTNLEESKILSIVEQSSYNLGALAEYNKDYIYFDNPIWIRPLIAINEKQFFCALPQTFFSFIFNSLNKLVETIDSELLSKRKSQFLEDSIEEIVKQRFPESNTVKNIKWKDGDKEYETDIITAIDSYVIIIEAKSGKIDSSSLRGAPKKLQRDINKLLIEPNIQSKRLKDKLLHLINNPDEKDELRAKLPFDLSQTSNVLRISVTLEYFATLQANMKKLSKTNWIPKELEYCPTMSLADFETVFDILEHPVEIINYLEKREYFEREVNFDGDEIDLLGYYIEYHLNVPPTNERYSFIISGMSNIVTNYYDSIDAGISIKKPAMKLNSLFKRVIEQLEARKTEGWTRIGSILCSFIPKDQDMLASKVLKLKTVVQKQWKKEGHKNTLIYIPPSNTSIALCYVGYNNFNKDKKYIFVENAAATALENEHVLECVVIGKNIDDTNVYDMIAVLKN